MSDRLTPDFEDLQFLWRMWDECCDDLDRWVRAFRDHPTDEEAAVALEAVIKMLRQKRASIRP